MGGQGQAGQTAGGGGLAGRWRRRVAGPGDLYPELLEFRQGTYLGTKSAEQRFIVWDAGTIRLDEGDDEAGMRLTLSTASDQERSYPFQVLGDKLTITLDDGTELEYVRDD